MELSPSLADLVPGSPDELRWPWLAVLLGSLLCGLALWWLRGRSRSGEPLLVSHSPRLLALPRFRTLVRRRRALLLGRGLAVLVALAGCLLLVARPSQVGTLPTPVSRDLVICLDVSDSMRTTSADVARVVRQVVDSLPGDRIGLTIFNAQTVVKFPLTDARHYVRDALDEAETVVADRDPSYTRATNGYPSSQVGDALFNCVRSFDRLDERRGRVVLVASDNRPYGRRVHTLAEAAGVAEERGVVVYALGVPEMERRPAAVAEFRDAAETTGGSLVVLDDPDAVDEVVAGIDRTERKRLQQPGRRVLDDRPEPGTLVVLGAVLALAASSWLRRRP